MKILDVAIEHFNLLHGHAPFDPALNTADLISRKVVSGLGA
ncbi:MAG: hypothetical protein PHR16_02205 [Methylovulum sp.]|nr:hypothetical protein [Methylovulum sp.]